MRWLLLTSVIYVKKKERKKNVTCIWYKLWWNKNKDGRKVWEGKEKGLKTHNMLPGHGTNVLGFHH